jgi:diacylglycerol kinase (ATP)
LKKRILFIINPIAGKKRFGNIEDNINRNINKSIFDYSILYSRYKGHTFELSKEAVSQNFDVVVAVGGDGTINEVASALVNSYTALAIIPSGSGNGLAYHLRIPINLKKSIQIINDFHLDKIDVCQLNQFFVFSVAGIGYDAKVAFDFNHGKGRGMDSYFRAILKNYFTFQSEKYIVEYDGEKMEKSAFFITFANSSQWGYNVKVAPHASIQDGLFDVCFCTKPETFTLSPFVIRLLTDRIDESREMQYLQCKHLTIKTKNNHPIYLHIDGDTVDPVTEIMIQIIPMALNVLTERLI